jgi:hypothetical protein
MQFGMHAAQKHAIIMPYKYSFMLAAAHFSPQEKGVCRMITGIQVSSLRPLLKTPQQVSKLLPK